MPPPPHDDRRVQTLCALIQTMPGLVVPELAPVRPPDAAFLADPAHLAKAAAKSSAEIAAAAAALGHGDDAAHARTLWTQTLAQIERVQALYGLPPLPFQPARKKPPTDDIPEVAVLSIEPVDEIYPPPPAG